MKHHATILLLFIAPSSSSSSSSTSTNTNSKSHQNILLKLQSRYNSKPPHSKSLYNILDLNSNCTSEQIVKAYRRKSRDYHPDKFDGDPQKLEQVREAYEVLRKDETRLPYHTFGVLGGDVKSAVDILTGEVSPSSSSDKKDDESIKELLSLMGYDGHISNNHRENIIFQSNNLPPPPPPPSSHQQQQHSQSHTKKNSSLQKQKQNQRRMSVIESDLKELVRPLIEGQITQEQMAHLMVQKSQSLKQIPLGPQILRCVGRAYRRAGQLCLSNNNNSLYQNQRSEDRIKQHLNSDKSLKLLLNTSQHKIKGSIRSAKHFAEAAFATGKLLYTEQKEKSRLLMLSNKNKKKNNDKKQIEYYENNRDEEDFYMNSFSASGSSSSSSSGEEDNFMFDDDFLFDESNINGDNDDEQEQQQSKEEQVIHKAIIQILQIEALWKITKIELDRIVFDACTHLLKIGGRNNKNNNHHHQYHGYISTTSGGAHQQHHEVISSDIMRLRAASALILIGDVYVRCSKEGTSWMD